MSEQNEITKVHGKGPVDVHVRALHLPIAVPGGVRGHLAVYVEVDSHAQYHLEQLEYSNDHIDPDWWACPSRGSQGVVGVHDSVHEVVECYEPLGRSELHRIVKPAVDKHGHVMVPVQEYQFLFAEYDEKRVD